MSLEGRHILLGITGSIAAYKAAILCRLLKGAGAEVKVVMTPLAKQFITPLTMATLSKHPILVEFLQSGKRGVELPRLARRVGGLPAHRPRDGQYAGQDGTRHRRQPAADDLPFGPLPGSGRPGDGPGHVRAFGHTGESADLRSRGVRIVEPAEGELASGLSGKGRMAEPTDIVAFVEALLSEKKKKPAGKRLIVTAGATIEAIDPVRFISNHSTGKMGYAIAEALARRGAEVVLISGRTSLPTPTGVRRIDVLSAQEMYEASVREFATADGAVMCAAVADYTPEEVAPTKLKKGDGELTIRLKRTHDIAAELGAHESGSDPGRLRPRNRSRRGQCRRETPTQKLRFHRSELTARRRGRIRRRYQQGDAHRPRRTRGRFLCSRKPKRPRRSPTKSNPF